MDSLRSYTHLMSLHLWKRRTFQHLPLNKAKLFLSQHPHFSLHPNHAPQQQTHKQTSTFQMCHRLQDGDLPQKGHRPPDLHPMSVVAKPLDGSRCHLVQR